MKGGSADRILARLLLGFLGAAAGAFVGMAAGAAVSNAFGAPDDGLDLDDVSAGVLGSLLGGVAGLACGVLLANAMANEKGRSRGG